MTIPTPGQTSPITGMPNLGNLGGWPTRTGEACAFSPSAEFSGPDEVDATTFAALGIRCVVHRIGDERAAQVITTPAATEYMILAILGVAGPAHVMQGAVRPEGRRGPAGRWQGRAHLSGQLSRIPGAAQRN